MRQNRWAANRGEFMLRAVVGVARLELRAIVVTILASALILAAFPVTVPVAEAAAPKVVIIVGPVGSRTDAYRNDGDQAARAARAAGANVVQVYSPDATWPRVRDALQGASLVVYMGHGNGWPSKYRDSPFPKTQNGLGLNPELGAGDDAHQYFGEAYLARAVKLAPHAVVLMFHLCYASGNSEPGLPEGSLATGQQRVDNYAAGWLAAGAEAVLAEGLGGPGYYVSRILAGDGTIESIWRRAPTAHGHVVAFPSERTPGMTGLMDPTRKTSGFYRSLVGRIELRADEVARGAAMMAPRGGLEPAVSDISLGPAVKDATLRGVPTAGSSIRVTLALAKSDRAFAKDLGIGVRWSPLALDPPPVTEEDASPSPAPSPDQSAPSPAPAASAPEQDTASSTPSPEQVSASPAQDAASGSPSPDPAAGAASPGLEAAGLPDAPPVVLISPEVPGTLVSVSDVKVKGSRLSADVIVPLEPGLYRLAVTLHDDEGVAFDAPTQDRIPAFTVRVTGELSTVVSATDRVSAAAGAAIELPVTVANTGTIAWVADALGTPAAGSPPRTERDELYAVLVGRWMRLDGSDVVPGEPAERATVNPSPGETQDVVLPLTAPSEAGTYLVVLDVVSPIHGSLMAVGSPPRIVRVEVTLPEADGATGLTQPEADGTPGAGPRDEPEPRRPRA